MPLVSILAFALLLRLRFSVELEALNPVSRLMQALGLQPPGGNNSPQGGYTFIEQYSQ